MPQLRDPEAQHQHSVPGPDPLAGLTRDQVRAVQRNLVNRGHHLVVDGIAGPLTHAAYVAEFGTSPTAAQTISSQAGLGGPPAPAPAPTPAAPGGPPSAAPSPAAAPAANVPPPGSDQDVRAKFGGWAWALDVPEVGDKLRQAAAEGWTPAQTQGAIEGTDWWKQTAAAGRNFQRLQGEDPAEANAQILQKRADISQVAAQLGILIDENRLTELATGALRYGLDATGLQQMIGSEFHYRPGGQTGLIGQAEVKLKAMAGDYMLPLSDDTLAGWEGQIAQGRGTAEGYQSYMVQQAKNLYGRDNAEVTRLLDEGATMQHIAQPFRDLAVNELGIAPDSINFTDPKWMRAISTNDPQTGQRRMMNNWEWQKTIRGDDVYGFKQSEKGKALAADVVLSLAKAFGRAS